LRRERRSALGLEAHAAQAQKARQLATNLRQERPDDAYLKEVFRQLRAELGIVVSRAPRRLPYVPTERRLVATKRPSGKPASLATWY
jgi:hypothetical protein